MHWGRKWQPAPVFLPGESQGQGDPGGLPSMGSHRVGRNWSDLAAAATAPEEPGPIPVFMIANWATSDKQFQLSCFSFFFFVFKWYKTLCSLYLWEENEWVEWKWPLELSWLMFLFSSSPCWTHKHRTGLLPEAWTSMMYWCRSWPCWMTSKVMLFMASFRSVWRCSRCSASVRSSVLKSFICRSKSSFQASSSAVTCKATTVSAASLVHKRHM